ncbi:hypothetical protein JCM10908_003780 [Rhodotorula pacifica]|uniref:SANT/Myb-like DNA-binding domain-containing protein n=1 Tax=Rhodotorula pacifica TaxID=1495444 RepID=UPI0031725A3A
MSLASSDELNTLEDDAQPPAKRIRRESEAEPLPSTFTFDAPPLSPPDELATPAGQAVTAQKGALQGLVTFYAGDAAQEDAGDTLAALNALLAGYDDNGTPLPVATPQDINLDLEAATHPAADSSEQDVLDRLSFILADTPDTPYSLAAAYPSPVSIASATTPAPSELSFADSRDSSASVEPEGSGGKKGKTPNRKYWTPEQDAALIAMREDPTKHDWTWKEIAELLSCGHRSVQCRARYLLLKDKQKISGVEGDPAAKIKQQGRIFFTANDDAIILAHLLGEVSIDWSVVGASLHPPRTGDSCYQRSRKLRKKTIAERRAILHAYNPPSPASLPGTPAGCPSPAFFAAVAPTVNPNNGVSSMSTHETAIADPAGRPANLTSAPPTTTESDVQVEQIPSA